MERQPRTSASGGGGIGGMISVQWWAPMKSCPLAPRAIRLWYPSVMMMGAGFTTLMLMRSKTVSSPQVVAAVVWPVHGDAGTGVPAIYMVVPSKVAKLATGTLNEGPLTGGSGARLSVCTLACVPPHSAPQFTT